MIKGIENYEKSSLRYIARMCLGFWIIILAVDKLPQLAETSDPFTMIVLSISLMIIGIDLSLIELAHWFPKFSKSKKEDKK